jgi:hypothetical protein
MLTGAQPQPLIANRTPVVRRQRPGRGVSARKRSRDAVTFFEIANGSPTADKVSSHECPVELVTDVCGNSAASEVPHEYVVRIQGLRALEQQQQKLWMLVQALENSLVKLHCRVRDVEGSLAQICSSLSPNSASETATGTSKATDQSDSGSATTLSAEPTQQSVALQTSEEHASTVPESPSGCSPRRFGEVTQQQRANDSAGAGAMCNTPPAQRIYDTHHGTRRFRLVWSRKNWQCSWIRFWGPVTIHTFASSNESAIRSQPLFPEALKAPQFLCVCGFYRESNRFWIRTTDGIEGFWANVEPSPNGGFQDPFGKLMLAERAETGHWLHTRVLQMDDDCQVVFYATIRRVWGHPIDTVQLEYDDGRCSPPLAISAIRFQCVAAERLPKRETLQRAAFEEEPYPWNQSRAGVLDRTQALVVQPTPTKTQRPWAEDTPIPRD